MPIITGIRDLVDKNIVPGGAYNNLDHMDNFIDWPDSIPLVDRLILCDPQTSGGLLIALPMNKVKLLMDAMDQGGVRGAKLIGEITDDPSQAIQILA